jgi:hypothetical protein
MKKMMSLSLLLLLGLSRSVTAAENRVTPKDFIIDRSGRAPDLGALEAGKPVPHYGPRQ